ncbi:MAG: cell division protein FtsA [Melioribacteraceae bacterium]|nr:cell division protein FtsA [Melioribacteraceae bacterium]
MKKNYIAGLDLGTTKVGAVIAEQTEDGLEVRGFSVVKSEGLSKGLVSNISKTAEAVKRAMEIASNRADIIIKEVNVGVAGEHITSLRHRNYVTINNPDQEVTQHDLDRLREDVKLIRIPSDRQILHIIPEEFIIDGQDKISDPLGMCGSKLEAVNHVVLASVPAIQNIKRSVERAGYTIREFILQPIASSVSVLEENEKDLGVVLIDIGGGTTDLAIIHDKSIKYTKVIGVAGNQVTNDIRESLGIVSEVAEKLKIEFGYAHEESIIKDEDIFIPGVGARSEVKIPVSLLTQIISVRMRELFAIIDNDIRQSGLKSKIKAGIVLTGGGSMLKGCKELAEEIFGLPTRIGLPLDLGKGFSDEIERPEFATVAGLIKGIPGIGSGESPSISKIKKTGNINFKAALKKVKDFFDEL